MNDNSDSENREMIQRDDKRNADEPSQSHVNRTPEEQRIYENKLKLQIEKHREEKLKLQFEVEAMKKELRNLIVDENDNK